MDLGLAGLADRFEQSFGPRVTKVGLGLIGLTTFCVCIKIIWEVVTPVAMWATAADGGGAYTRSVIAVLTISLTGILLVGIAISISDAFEDRLERSELRAHTDEAREVLDDVKRLRGETAALLSELHRIRDDQYRAVCMHCKV